MDKYLLHYKGSKQVLALLGLITLVQASAILVQAAYLAKGITQMFQGTAWAAILHSFALFAVAHMVRQLTRWAKERIAYRFAEQTALTYQELLLTKLFQLGPRTVGQYGSGHLITLTLEGVAKFKKYLELIMPRMLAMGMIPAWILFYIWTIDTLSALTLLVVMPILITFLILIGILSQNKIDEQMETYRLLARHFVDSLRGILTLKFLGRSKAHEQAIATVSDQYRLATNRSLRYAFLSSFSLDFFSSLSVAVVAVELGLRLINGSMPLEPALIILILAPEYFSPVRELGNDFHATMDGKDASEQIRSILLEQTLIEPRKQRLLPWSAHSKLSIHGLTQTSPEGRTLLEQINIEVHGFQKIGIVGSSGAGKSTLIDLLAGFVRPVEGSIRIEHLSRKRTNSGQSPQVKSSVESLSENQLDHNNSLEVSHLAFSAWQEQVTYIPQHPTVFADTVANNIRFYQPQASEQDVMLAAEQVGLSNLIASFPQGLQEVIGQGGRSLSGGEEQRIAVARSLVCHSPIMLFDEPTAHLDIETEHELKQVLLPLLENKLVFFATHRLHWMKEMDVIYVLQAGQIVEWGTHEDLLKQKGAYAHLVSEQQKGMSL